MRTFVKCDKQGTILSTTRVESLPEGFEHPYPDLAEGELVIEVKPTEALDAMSCAEIHRKYKVDVRKKKLLVQK